MSVTLIMAHYIYSVKVSMQNDQLQISLIYLKPFISRLDWIGCAFVSAYSWGTVLPMSTVY